MHCLKKPSPLTRIQGRGRVPAAGASPGRGSRSGRLLPVLPPRGLGVEAATAFQLMNATWALVGPGTSHPLAPVERSKPVTHSILQNLTRLSAALAMAALLSHHASAQQPSERERAAAALGVLPSSLMEGHVDSLVLPTLGLEVSRIKAVEVGSGRILRLDLDPSGRSVDVAALMQAEQEAIAADPLAKMDQRLRSSLSVLSSGEQLSVVAWVAMDGRALDDFAADRLGHLDGRTTPRAELAQAEAEVREHVMARVSSVVDGFRLSAAIDGLAVRSSSRVAPMVFLDVNGEQLLRLAARSDVRAVFLVTGEYQDLNDEANSSHRTNSVKSAGVKGAGIRVAVLENNGVLPACPYLDVEDWFNSSTYNPDDHIHGTSGCIASSKGDREGAAPDVDLFCANASSYGDDDVTDAADWIGTKDIDITNLSWGNTVPSPSLNSFDHYFNYASRYLRDSYVAAAGNDGTTLAVSSPAKAYNVIGVGSFNEQGNGSWTDDTMSSFSNAGNPANGCEKPNLVANGSDIDTIGFPSPWEYNASGTSFSSPHVVGNLADAMSVNAEPIVSPEAAMALMMATAWHNVEGEAIVSHEDGAGGLHGWAAYQCAKDDRVDGDWLTAADFDASDQYVYQIYLDAGKKTRVCVAWSAEDAGFGGPDFLTSLIVDLDAVIISNPSGSEHTILASSASSTDNFEMLEFTPTITGWYGVRLDHGGSITGTDSHPWGIAWSQSCDMNAYGMFEIAGLIPFGALYLDGPTIGTPYELVVNFPGDNLPYVVVPSGDDQQGLPLSPDGGLWLPAGFDIWTSFWLATVGGGGGPWINSIGSSGQDGFSPDIQLLLPNKPSLVGKEVHHMALELDSNLMVAEVGQKLSAVVMPLPLAVPPGDSVAMQLPMPFPFYGTSYTDLYVSEDGYVSFGQPIVDPTETAAEFLSGPPRIAYAYDDMNRATPGAALQVRVISQGAKRFVVEMMRVPEQGVLPGQNNTVRLTLHEDGTIEMSYAACALMDGLVGISPGNDLSQMVSVDLTSSGERTSGILGALYEVFDGQQSSFDLGAKLIPGGKLARNVLTFIPVDGQAVDYRLEMSVR